MIPSKEAVGDYRRIIFTHSNPAAARQVLKIRVAAGPPESPQREGSTAGGIFRWTRRPGSVSERSLDSVTIRAVHLAVVGAGASGLVSAWLLQSEHEVTCYESEAQAGGNARPAVVEAGAERLEVAMGPTYFLPRDYRVLMAIFAELGVKMVRLPTSLTIYGQDGGARFVSPTLRPRRLHPLLDAAMVRDLSGWRKMLAATLALRRAGDTQTTWGEFVSSLRLPARFVEEIADAVASAFLGVTFDQLRGVSACSALLYPALAMPTPTRGMQVPLAVGGGTHRWIEQILGQMGRVRLRLGDPVRSVTRRGGGVVVESEGETRRYDAAVVTVPIWQAGAILGGVVAEAAALVPFTEAELVVHRDGSPLRRHPRSDSEVSVRTFAGAAQLATAAGQLSGREVFRSWVTHDPHPPAEVLARARYRHPIPVPAAWRAQQLVRQIDGRDRIHLAGSWTRDVDSHESAVVSAVEVALRLLGDRTDVKKLLPDRAPLGFGHHTPY